MSNRLRTILIGAVGVIVVLLGGVFSGALDGVLRQLNFQIAGHPAPAAGKTAATDVVATPISPKTDPAPAPSATEAVVPTFDLVRVEPTGDAVIAGRSAPNSKVEILSGKDVVATGKANDTGSWAIVLADPLKSGAHDLSVRATGPDGKVATSEQSVAVSVPEGGNGDVLVVLNQPGSPSTVLQVPGIEEAQAKLADAGVDPAQAVETAPPVSADLPKASAGVPTAVEPPTSASATAMAIAGNATMPATTAEPAPAAMASEPAPTSVVVPAPPADMQAAAASPALAQGEPAPTTNNGAKPATQAPAEPASPQATASTTPAAAPSSAPKTEAPTVAAATLVVTIDAVELENGKHFYAAGSAANGAVIRLYVDDKATGDVKAEKGRWLYQGEVDLAPGKHLVRIDQIGENGAVVARAEVPFQIAEDGMATPMLASGVGSAQAGAGSAGEAKPAEPTTLIIHRGDNLWMIARRLYGDGFRYSTIYQANTDQIRNPDLIYPGQVFVIPEGDAAWKPVGQ